MNANTTLNTSSATLTELRNLLEHVTDPEIPVISIAELGILRNVELEQETVTVTITPTYSGCPAMHEISNDIKAVMRKAGIKKTIVELQLTPPWTTDWMSQTGRDKLQQYGIAPPLKAEQKAVRCPQCGSNKTTKISEFGSTACKALYKCQSCLEPFDYFKCL